MKTIAAATLGCKVNLYETEAALEAFKARGWRVVGFDELADAYIINTCTVTNLGDRKSRQLIARARRRNPAAVVAAVGCYTQMNPQAARGLGADVVCGVHDRAALADLIENHVGAPVTRIAEGSGVFEALSVTGMGERARAFLKIQDGCDRFCAYCAIPYARGRSRSRAEDDVAAQAQALAAAGYREIVLAGIHVASYGKDLSGTNLQKAIERVCAVDGVERVRLSSLEPTVMTEGFVAFLANSPKICNHFHLSLQSGCDRTLAAMNRRYTAAQYAEAVSRLRAAIPGVSVTTDVIAGFPGETEADFAEGFAFIEGLGLSRLHVFPFSAKKGTAAAGMDGQIPQAVRKERAARLSELSGRLHGRFLGSLVGTVCGVLVEESADGASRGLTGNYAEARFGAAFEVGGIATVRIVEATESSLVGELVES